MQPKAGFLQLFSVGLQKEEKGTLGLTHSINRDFGVEMFVARSYLRPRSQ